MLGRPSPLSGPRGSISRSSFTKTVRTIVEYAHEADFRALEYRQLRSDRRGLLSFLVGLRRRRDDDDADDDEGEDPRRRRALFLPRPFGVPAGRFRHGAALADPVELTAITRALSARRDSRNDDSATSKSALTMGDPVGPGEPAV